VFRFFSGLGVLLPALMALGLMTPGLKAEAQPVSTAKPSPTVDDFFACKPLAEPAARLACLDRLLGKAVLDGNARETGALAAPADRDRLALAGTPETPRVAEDSFGFSAEQVARDKRPDRQTAETVSISRTRSGKYVIVLENGQIWRQLKADTRRLIVNNDGAGAIATIKKQSLGSHALTLNGSKRSIKVKRIK